MNNFTQRRLKSPEQISQVRTLFPHTSRGLIYLNHAATGPLSTRVIEAMSFHLQARSGGVVDTYTQDLKMVTECRANVQKMINAESPDRIALVTNTSDSLNIVASGLQWKTGDRILSADLEFPANVYPYLNLRKYGVELDVIQSKDGRVPLEKIERAITPRTRLVALSAVQFLSGYRADLAAIGDVCRRKGILFVVDGIQAVGAIQIDVQGMKIDAFGAGAQKWQMGPHGTGFLYLTEELQNAIQQQYLGWLSVTDPWAFHNYRQALASSARRYEGGTLNFPGLWGMNAALSVLLEFGIEAVESHILALTQILTDRLRTLDGFSLYSPESAAERAGIVTIHPTKERDLSPTFQAMMERRIAISLREGKLRFSPHFYNTPEEIETTVLALTELSTASAR